MEKQTFANLQEKLLYIQQNLKAPKNQYNSFGEYNYRSCEDIQEGVKPLLKEVGAVLLVSDDIVLVGDRFYIKATATLQDTASETRICNTAYARETDSKPKMDAAQITGSASSYARKYALNGLFCIDDAKDPDYPMPDKGQKTEKPRWQQNQTRQNSNCAGASQSRAVYIGQQHINTIRREIERTGAQERGICHQYKIKSLQEMTVQQFTEAMGILKCMEDARPKQPEPYQMTLDGMEQYNEALPFR